MNARYYDPSNGRFISQDSYRGSVNEPSQWHLYVYCANNPINYVDPSGHWSWHIPTWVFGDVLDLAASCIGVGVSFNVIKIAINKAYKSKKLRSAAIESVNKLVIKYKINSERIKSAIKWLGKKKDTALGKVFMSVAKYFGNYGMGKINGMLFDKLIKNSSYLLSPGAFIAGAVDYNMNGRLKGKLWKINLPNWTKGVLQWL